MRKTATNQESATNHQKVFDDLLSCKNLAHTIDKAASQTPWKTPMMAPFLILLISLFINTAVAAQEIKNNDNLQKVEKIQKLLIGEKPTKGSQLWTFSREDQILGPNCGLTYKFLNKHTVEIIDSCKHTQTTSPWAVIVGEDHKINITIDNQQFTYIPCHPPCNPETEIVLVYIGQQKLNYPPVRHFHLTP